jgi:hypothetical protein
LISIKEAKRQEPNPATEETARTPHDTVLFEIRPERASVLRSDFALQVINVQARP